MTAKATNNTKKQQLCVRVIIRNDKGQILLGCRATGKAFSGFWEYPGGKVDPGEIFSDTAAREVKEETNLDIFNMYIVGVEDTADRYPIQYFVLYVEADVKDLSTFEHVEESKTETWQWFDEDKKPSLDLMLGDIEYPLKAKFPVGA